MAMNQPRGAASGRQLRHAALAARSRLGYNGRSPTTPECHRMSVAGLDHLHLDLPVNGLAKELIERAAQAAGQSVGEFAAAAVVEKAEQVLRGTPPRALSGADARAFLDLLDAAPAPNDALRRAAQRFPPRHD